MNLEGEDLADTPEGVSHGPEVFRMRMPLPHKRQAGQAHEKHAQATGQEREAQNG